jgi:hypothetical protein
MFNETPDHSGSSYEILLKDHLESHWSEYFDGWAITNLEKGEVLLTNRNIDQAGLHGVLNRIRDLNLTLLSVSQTNRKNG